jgi:hypothetical protein
VYLNELWHADAWIRGGRIPISLASTYKSEVRDGILTPDENLIYDSPLDFKEEYSPYIKIDGSVIGLTIMNLQINGVKFPGVVNVSRYVEDGIILSFCKKFDVEIGRRFKGKVVCVRIFDIHNLFKVIDSQLSVSGRLRDCVYTDTHQRNHFLKSRDDSWQEETRMFWGVTENALVELPPGLAEIAGYID